MATMVVNKSDFEDALQNGQVSDLSGLKMCNIASITKDILSYNGTQYQMDCSGMESFGSAYKGETIGTITDLTISMKPFLYNGLYYATIQDLFNGSGLMPVLMSSQDLVNWDFVKVFDEVTWDTFVETCIVIKDGIVYFAGRPVSSQCIVEMYDLANDTVVCQPYNLPLSLSCKPAMTIFNERVILAQNFPCKYDNNEGFRKNLGLWEIKDDGACDLLDVILSQSGLHYPDFVQANDELYLLASNDYRFIARATQRTSIGFAKILV
jgi:hypothetical protein